MAFLENLRPIVYENSMLLKVVIIVVGSVIMVCTSGLFYAWPSLLISLEGQGVYSEYCWENVTQVEDSQNVTMENVDCIDRDLAFNRIFTYAMVTNCIGSFIHGSMVDVVGGRIWLLISYVSFTSGCVLFAQSSFYFDMFPVAACLIVFGGAGFFFACFPLFYTMGKHRDLTLTILSFAWDSSVVVFLAYSFVYRETGLPYQTFFMYLMIPAFVVLLLIPFYPRPPPPSPEDEEDELQTEGVAPPPKESEKLIEKKSTEEEKSFFSYALSPLFIGYCIYYGIFVLWCNLYIGTIYDQVSFIGLSHETKETAVLIFGVIFTCALFAGIFVAWLIDYLNTVPNFIVIQALFFMFTILKLIPNLYVQYFNFVLFILARGHFYCFTWVWVAQVYPKKFYGKLIGISQVVAGLATLLQYPIYLTVKAELNNRFALIDVAQGVTIALGTAFIIAVAHLERNKYQRI